MALGVAVLRPDGTAPGRRGSGAANRNPEGATHVSNPGTDQCREHEVPGSEGASATPSPGSDEAASARVYEELGRLAEFMPQRYREVFCFRWGLRGQFPHLVNQAALKFEVTRSTVELMLDRCLWNVARHARAQELPAIREVLGEDPERWAERAWAHAERRWGNQICEFAETVLLLSVAGLDVPEAHRVARQHVVDIGLGRGNRWGRPLTDREQADASRRRGGPDARARDLAFRLREVLRSGSVQRPAATCRRGRHRRSVCSRAPSLAGWCSSSPSSSWSSCASSIATPVSWRTRSSRSRSRTCIDGEAREYTPDVLVRLDDGRAFIIEAKPEVGLGDFTNWMKWACLARWCEQAGIGFWIGSPQRSIAEHRGMRPDPELRELVVDEVRAGEVAARDYTALRGLVPNEQLGRIATAELLDWRADLRRMRARERSRPDRSATALGADRPTSGRAGQPVRPSSALGEAPIGRAGPAVPATGRPSRSDRTLPAGRSAHGSVRRRRSRGG